MKRELKFECPRCGHDTLNDVTLGCAVTHDIAVMDFDDEDPTFLDILYGEQYETEYGSESFYECGSCLYVVGDGDHGVGSRVLGSHQLLEWLLKQPYNQDDQKQEA